MYICWYINHTLIAGAGGHIQGGIPRGRYARMHTTL